MAKTESTAVNELINLVQTATPLKPDPTEDLMFKAPDKRVSARMAPAMPSIRADVPALPRQRAPQGTQRGVPIVNDHPPAKPSVRMSTASRPVTIPPISKWTSPEGTGESDTLEAVTAENIATKPTRPSLPLPHRGSSPPAIPPRMTGAMRAEPARVEASPSPIARVEVAAPSPTTPALPALVAGYPSAAPYLPPVSPDMTSHQPWFEDQQGLAVDEIEVDLGTDRVRAKSTDWKTLLPKLIEPTLGLIILGMFVGGFLAFDGQGGKKDQPQRVSIQATASDPAAARPALAPAADQPAAKAVEQTPAEPVAAEPAKPVADEPAKVIEPKAVEPKVAEPITPPNLAPHAKTADAPKTEPIKSVVTPVVPGRPTFVDVRIDSTPAGATVTLVDRGKTLFLGTTPISTALDPSRQYDVVFSYANKPTQIERLDPATTKRFAVVLGKTAKKPEVKADKKAEAPKTEAKAEKRAEAPKTEKKLEPKADAPKTEVKAPDKKPDSKKAVVDPFDAKPETKPEPKPEPKVEAPAGEGVLMISSKPPCEIYVDGVPTGLTTPQRALKLPAGKHKITLVNEAEKIKKTLPVTISPDQPAKVIENFMK